MILTAIPWSHSGTSILVPTFREEAEEAHRRKNIFILLVGVDKYNAQWLCSHFHLKGSVAAIRLVLIFWGGWNA
jgi:hypothetical protein